MKKMFNCTIPYKRRDKGFRACYKYMNYDSCVFEASYYEFSSISFSSRLELDKLIEEYLRRYTINSRITNANYKQLKCHLYSTSGKLIGPVDLHFLEKTLLFKYHPLMKSEIKESINSFFSQVPDLIIKYDLKVNNFKLFGIGSILFKVLKSISTKENLTDYYEESQYFERDLHKMPDGTIIVFKINKPTAGFKMNEFVFKKLNDKLFESTNQDVMMHKNCDQMISDYNIKYCNSFIESLKIKTNEKLIDYPDERTVFQHRKVLNLDKINKKIKTSFREKKMTDNYSNKIKLQIKKSHEKNINEKEIFFNPKEEVFNKINILSTFQESFILVVKDSITKVEKEKKIKFPVIDLIFPNGYSVDLLRRFIYLESRAIGLCELNYFLKINDVLIFPNDYPSTRSYLEYMREKTKNKIDKYCKRPASKRVNFQKIANPFPFYSAWHRLKSNTQIFKFQDFNKATEVIWNIKNKSLVHRQFEIQNIKNILNYTILLPISLQMLNDGVPRFNSHICLPSKEDLEFIRNHRGNDFKSKILRLFDSEKESRLNLINSLESYKSLNYNNIIEEEKKIIEPVQRNKIVKNKNFNLEYETIIKIQENEAAYYSSDILNTDLTLKLQRSMSRQLIGFVTSGCYSYSHCKGIAKGFILLDSYEQLLNLKNFNHNLETLVLIRNPTSLVYYPAKINLYDI
jgi:hypothetical protein